ncbi:hypothetical protein Rxyl_0708 [Rubrobacter xylanophilus DSM 9941]|uniref:Uncharacterized protein n=1 Tax=Rubrobacter xylanophilus (strain DSM 9941 / JCM 11954 / NBRC 16129 / PRD-1) TaxID=266117 RepID=Q1AY50_RUBXD|nr:hypothetical protein [Rubrobacter xylanophilus]ABG03678.1 hypothetical protein Rxyl_0708 [Rubrobacter xylanophilus DSM 9941]
MEGDGRVRDIELAEDLGFQERMWRAQRISWAVMAALALAALLGLFGGGPLAGASAGGGEVSVPEYERFVRFGSPTTLRVRLEPPAGGGEVRLWVEQGYLEGVRLQRITPEPAGAEAARGGVLYTFRASGGPAVVTFDLEPDRAGLLEGSLRSGGGSVTLRQFVYP